MAKDTDTLVQRLRTITPDVPEVIMDQARDAPLMRHLLNQGSVLDQQNVIIGETLDRVLTQTTETNGRVRTVEARDGQVKEELKEHSKILDQYQRQTSRRRHWQSLRQGAIYPFLTALFMVVLEALLKHYHLI